MASDRVAFHFFETRELGPRLRVTAGINLHCVKGWPKSSREMPKNQARLCPYCRGLNSAGERRCYRCGRALPGPLVSGALGFVQRAVAGDAAVTTLFLGFCVLVFGLCFATDRRLPLFSDQFSLSTTLRFGALIGSLGSAQPFRYLAAVFVHYNAAHLAMNGFVLSRVGAGAERSFGKARFVILFALSGVLGFLVSDQWYRGMSPPTAGASGALFGLFGSMIGVAYARRDPNWKQLLLENVIWLGILAFLGPVNNAAHAGGLVTGSLLGYLFSKESRKLKLDLALGGLAGLLLASCLVSVALSAASPIWRSVREQELSRRY